MTRADWRRALAALVVVVCATTPAVAAAGLFMPMQLSVDPLPPGWTQHRIGAYHQVQERDAYRLTQSGVTYTWRRADEDGAWLAGGRLGSFDESQSRWTGSSYGGTLGREFSFGDTRQQAVILRAMLDDMLGSVPGNCNGVANSCTYYSDRYAHGAELGYRYALRAGVVRVVPFAAFTGYRVASDVRCEVNCAASAPPASRVWDTERYVTLGLGFIAPHVMLVVGESAGSGMRALNVQLGLRF